MARKKRKTTQASAANGSGQSSASTTARTAKQTSQSRRKWLLAAVGAVGAVGGGSALHAWDSQSREQHDLSAIGQGTPVVVQVHDRSCPTCRRLKGVMGGVMKERDDILYRVADLAKPEGQALAQEYDVPKVTLLFFDEKGDHQYTHSGLLSAEEVTQLIDQHN